MHVVSRYAFVFFLLFGFSFALPLTPASAAAHGEQKHARRITHLQNKIEKLDRKYQIKKTRLEYRITRQQTRATLRTSGHSYCIQHRLNEKQCIEAWIARNNLNEYGDPKDSAYAGGTPLFDEATGKYINRYWYIRTRHPDLPWWRMQ